MASGMRLLVVVVLLAAAEQAAAGAVKASKSFSVKGISKTGSDPVYKLPTFKSTTFTYAPCRGHAADYSLTIKDVQGAPLVQYYRSTSYPETNGVKIIIATSTPRITVITFSPSKELTRLVVDLRAYASDYDKSVYQELLISSLDAVATYAVDFAAPWSQQDCNSVASVPYSKDITKVVDYIKNLAAALK